MYVLFLNVTSVVWLIVQFVIWGYRLDIYNARFTPLEKKAHETQTEQIKNRVTGKLETFVTVFDDVVGVNRVEVFEKQSVKKSLDRQDLVLANEEDADDTYNEIVKACRGIRLDPHCSDSILQTINNSFLIVPSDV